MTATRTTVKTRVINLTEALASAGLIWPESQVSSYPLVPVSGGALSVPCRPAPPPLEAGLQVVTRHGHGKAPHRPRPFRDDFAGPMTPEPPRPEPLRTDVVRPARRPVSTQPPPLPLAVAVRSIFDVHLRPGGTRRASPIRLPESKNFRVGVIEGTYSYQNPEVRSLRDTPRSLDVRVPFCLESPFVTAAELAVLADRPASLVLHLDKNNVWQPVPADDMIDLSDPSEQYKIGEVVVYS